MIGHPLRHSTPVWPGLKAVVRQPLRGVVAAAPATATPITTKTASHHANLPSEALAVAEAVYESAETGRVVAISPRA